MDDAADIGTAGTTAGAVDLAGIVRAAGGREALARVMARAFLQEADAHVSSLARARDEEDHGQLSLLAHQLKGNAKLLRAARAASLAEELERAVQAGGGSGVRREVEDLSAEVRAVAAALARWVEALPGG